MKRNRGFTLVELMVVIAVAAIGITLAIPSFRDVIERKQVGGAAEAAYEQLLSAKSQALKRSKPIVVDFYVNGTDWAIGLTDKLTGCNAGPLSAAPCTIDYDNDSSTDNNILMVIGGADYKNITMSRGTGFSGTPGGCTTTNDEEACFDFMRGLARAGAYDFESANYKLSVEVTTLGHVNICVPDSEKKIVGYNDC